MTESKCSTKLHEFKVSCRQCSLIELCLPRGLTPRELEELQKCIITRAPLPRGATLFIAGDHCESLFAVKSGSIKSVLPSEDGEEQIVGFHMPGEIFGMDGLAYDQHTCTAIALERTLICEIPFQQLDKICQSCPGFLQHLNRFIGGEIVQDQSLLLLLAKRNAEQRLASFILNLSNRFKMRGLSGVQFYLSMSRYDIANYLGLAPETVSRQLTRFHDNNLIKLERRQMTLQNVGTLYDIAGINEHKQAAQNQVYAIQAKAPE